MNVGDIEVIFFAGEQFEMLVTHAQCWCVHMHEETLVEKNH